MTDRISCIIVDDEQGAIEILEKYVSKVENLELIKSFTDPLEALSFLSNRQVDLIFMDINMPDLNGLQLSRLVKSPQTSIIFCTAYQEHALDSYEVPALDYLLKPIPFERFIAAVNKVPSPSGSVERGNALDLPPGHRQIFIKSGSQIHQVDTGKISLIKKDGHYIIFKANGKELLSRMSFTELLQLLPTDEFIQVHRSYVVAVNKIEVIQKQFLEINGKEIPIGDVYKKAFFKRVNYIGN